MTETLIRVRTLGELINLLANKGNEQITGLGMGLHSWRGASEHVAIEPSLETRAAKELSRSYKSQIGNTMFGYKGGEYTIRSSCDVYLAAQGDVGNALFVNGSGSVFLVDAWDTL